MPPLNDAQLGAVTRATLDDLGRYDSAELARSRQFFGSATIRDRTTGTVTTFGHDDFDAYQAYLRKEGQQPQGLASRYPTDWPILRVSFFTHRKLIQANTTWASGLLYFCDANDPRESSFFGSAEVMWRDNFVTGKTAPDIEAALKITPEAQEYEIFFPYTNIEEQRPLPRGARFVTLTAPTSDVCFALVKYNTFWPPSEGQPLRIEKQALAAALGPLPRTVPIPRR